jgi:cardiolipin synthase A/B
MRLRALAPVPLVVALLAVGLPAASASTSSTSSEYTLVTEPADGYHRIDALITGATKTLDMTMYELTDTTAEQDLAADASKGVAVRVILDQNREKSNNTAAYDYLSGHGVQVVWAPSTYEATHQKTITVDGTESAIMSGNLTSQYYSTSRDFDVLDTNKVDVGAIEKVFDADFAGSSVTPGDGDNLTWSPTDAQASLLGVINSATSTLQVENEEMADTAITDALVAAAKRGVDVEVTMTANSDYDSDFDDIVAAGGHVSTYPDDETSLYIHAKVIIADGGASDHNAYVGSINFSDASMNHNRELGFLTTNDDVVAGLDSALTSDFAGATPYAG